MSRNIKIINVDRQPLKIGTTVIAPATAAGTTPTTVNLNTPKVRRDLRTHYDRYVVVEGLQGAANATVGKSVTIAAATQAATTRTLTLTVKDAEGNAVTGRNVVDVWVGTSATDPTLGTAPSSAIAVNGGFGVILASLVATKMFRCITNASGVLKLDLTNSAPASFFIWVALADGTTTVATVAIA